jgi:RecG-like helicase
MIFLSKNKRALTVFKSVKYMRGVGPVFERVLSKAGFSTVFDLVSFLPTHYFHPAKIKPAERGSIQKQGEVLLFGKLLDGYEAFFQKTGVRQLELLMGMDRRPEVKLALPGGKLALYTEQLHIGDWVLVQGNVQDGVVLNPKFSLFGKKRPSRISKADCVVYPFREPVRPHQIRALVHRAVRSYGPQLNLVLKDPRWSVPLCFTPERILFDLHLHWNPDRIDLFNQQATESHHCFYQMIEEIHRLLKDKEETKPSHVSN